MVSKPFCLHHVSFVFHVWLVMISFQQSAWLIISQQKVLRTLHATGQPTCWAMQPDTLFHISPQICWYLFASVIFKIILCLLSYNLMGLWHLFLYVLGHLGIITLNCFVKSSKIYTVCCLLEQKTKESFIYKVLKDGLCYNILHSRTKHLYLLWFYMAMFLRMYGKDWLVFKNILQPCPDGRRRLYIWDCVIFASAIKQPSNSLHQIALICFSLKLADDLQCFQPS